MQSKPPPTPPTAPPYRDACPPHTGRETSGSAIGALVLGVCGITVVPLVCSVLALVFGYRARREIDRCNGTIGGRNYATAGIVLGWVGVAVVVRSAWPSS